MSTISYLSNLNIIPECIIVSIPNTDRTRDMTPTHSTTDYDGTENEDFLKTSGGGENFLKFINEELIPVIDENYNTMKLKVFIGHSFGGLTTAQSFLSNSSPFNAYISMDPSMWWDNGLCIKQLKSAKTLSNTKSWYMSAANNNEFKKDTTNTRKLQGKFNELLLQQPNTIRTKLKIYEDEDHQSVTLKSLYDGMRFTFSSYRITKGLKEDVAAFKDHFEQLSAEWGEEFKPSEGLINTNAYALIRQKKFDIALDFCKLNIELYPQSYNAYDSIAECYLKMGNEDLAKINYNKSLELNPNNQNAVEMLKEIK
jgi:predicted alpha/beta superfamily hydrolase